ncbi:hypothetical protein N0V94_003861 [Neodidymelliopsis sp. IMI 364377]|nr:hypothetical protein N0V94_003861 [Neodidymelliopsis sp. IMI 364377]
MPSRPLRELGDQLPTPLSSNATPERQSQHATHGESKENLQKKVRTPVQTGKDQGMPKPLDTKLIAGAQDGSQRLKPTQVEPGSKSLKYKETSSTTSLSTSTQAAEATPSRSSPDIVARNVKKRQRNDTGVVAQSPKRLRQSSDVIPPLMCTTTKGAALVTEGSDSAAPASMQLAGKQRTAPHQRPRAQAVQPESSFAPVAPNPECDFKLLDYDDNSVPVLYSATITHTDSTELLNSPPEELIFDALDAVERGFKPDRYGWPSAIGLLGRKPNKDMPTKVLNDIDLYLHESDGKLYVATDQGLIIVAQYLKLIGVPDTQPVRFNGRIPPWAKAALNAREKRRVVRSFGLSRETAGLKTAKRVSEEHDGNLSLKLGSSIVVYKIDENDEWAYGRSCEEDKKGWFPISYTCPVDWSLDRFSGSNAALLNMPLPNSNDKEEKDWRGLLHWYRQKGFPEPTPVVTTVAAEISQVVAPGAPPKTSKISAGPGTILDPVPGSIVSDASSGNRVFETPVKQPANQVITAAVPTLEPPEKHDNADPPATASECTSRKEPIFDTRDQAQTMRSETGEETEETEIAHPEPMILQHNIEPADTTFEAPPLAKFQLNDAREAMNEREVGSTDTLDEKKKGKQRTAAACGD